MLRAPSLISQLPTTVEKQEGEQLRISCSFDGDPTPLVTWFEGGTRLTEPESARNDLTIESVTRSTVLTCRGDNFMGTTDKTVQLNVIPRGTIFALLLWNLLLSFVHAHRKHYLMHLTLAGSC